MKVCPICKTKKELSCFDRRGPSRPNEAFTYCKACRSIRRKKEFELLKIETFNAYGGIFCKCCGESLHISFLALDHIENNGAAERRELHPSERAGVMFYAYLKKQGWPAGYQVLCHNCNMAKAILGICPHQLRNGVIGNTFGSEPKD